MRRVPEVDSVLELPSQERGSGPYSVQRQLAVRLPAHHAHINAGAAKVTGCYDFGHADYTRDPRVLDLLRDQVADFGAKQFVLLGRCAVALRTSGDEIFRFQFLGRTSSAQQEGFPGQD